jgi:signal transduction histidine kinase
MMSIRRRTALLVATSMVGLLAAGGAVLYAVLHRTLTAQFDAALAARAEALRSLARFDGEKIEFDFAGEAMPRYASGRSGEAEYFVVWVREPSGGAWRLLERSESLGATSWPGAATDETADLRLPDGSSGRDAVVEFVPPREYDEDGDRPVEARQVDLDASAPKVRILVAASRRSLDHALAAVGWSIAGVGAAMALASILAAGWAVRRGMMPLNDMSRCVAAISPSTLDARFDHAELPAELRPIADQLTSLLARVREAFERERRFSAAASHELRTPIAELQMLLEVASSRPRTSDEWGATTAKALDVLDRARALTNALLQLSRSQSSAANGCDTAGVALAPIIRAAAERALKLHGVDRGLLQLDCHESLTARIGEPALMTTLGNLFDNALRHGQVSPAHPVACVAGALEAGVELTISNHAPTLADGHLNRLFEPFWQADAARAERHGFGLGLSLCKALVESSGGRIDAAFGANEQLRVTVRLPGTNSER